MPLVWFLFNRYRTILADLQFRPVLRLFPMYAALIEFDIAATLSFFLHIIKLFVWDNALVVHGQHVAATW